MRKIKKYFIYFVALSFILSYFQISNVLAASFSVGASTSSVDSGGSFNVSVNVDGAGLFGFSGSNASVSAGSMFCDGSCSVSVTAGSSGTASVSVSAIDVTGYDETAVIGSQTVSVVINTPSGGGTSGGGESANGGGASNGGTTAPTKEPVETENKSSDNALSSLVVSKGTLDPIFETGTTEYKIALAADVTALSIEATPNDSKASVSGTGEQTVKPGDNKLEVVVTAENGATKAYVINAYVDEKPTSFLNMNGKDFGVVPNVDNVSLPTGFEKTTITIDGKEIPVWKNSISNITLVYLINEKSEKNFYIFENNQATSIYKPIALLGYNFAIIDIPEDLQKRSGFVFMEVDIDGHKLPGWTFENVTFANYSLIYVMNEKGVKEYYQYEKNSNTLQPYSGAAAITQDLYEQQTSMIFILWVVCGVLSVTTIMFLLMWVLRMRKNKRHKIKEEDSDVNNEYEHKNDTVDEEVQNISNLDISSSVDDTIVEEKPKRRSRIPVVNSEHIEKEAKFGTQPFRFHDDFEDKK